MAEMAELSQYYYDLNSFFLFFKAFRPVSLVRYAPACHLKLCDKMYEEQLTKCSC